MIKGKVLLLQLCIILPFICTLSTFTCGLPVATTTPRTTTVASAPSSQPKLRPHQTTKANNTPTRVQTSGDLSTKIVLDDDHQAKNQAPSRGKSQRQGKKLKIDISHLFREEVDDYPEDEIKTILKHTSETVKGLYNVLNTPLDPNVNFTERVAHYHGDDYEHDGLQEESICRTVTRNIYPREVNRLNSLVYVPNNQDFMQVIQAELCQKPDQDCNYLPDSLPYGMTSICYQKYAYKKLLYLDPLEKRMASDLFRYPSCCSCYIRYSSIDLRSSKANNRTTADAIAISKNSTSDLSPSLPTGLDNRDLVEKKAATSIRPLTTTPTSGDNIETVVINNNDNNNSSKNEQETIRSQEPRSNQTTVVSVEDKIFIPIARRR